MSGYDAMPREMEAEMTSLEIGAGNLGPTLAQTAREQYW